MMNRDDHLAWCKQRALEYVDTDPLEAMTSMGSDLNKHPETRNHLGIDLGLKLYINGNLSTVREMRHFIEGFN